MRVVVLLLAVACCVHAVPLNLYLVNNTQGAVCLDGTLPGFYYRAGKGVDANKWIVHFEGGGWCTSPSDCLARSKTNLGSSSQWTPTASYGGIFNDNANVNPDFASFSAVYLKYCDGASFSGDRYDGINVQGSTIWMRGHRIVNVLYNYLNTQLGLSKATHLLVTGCSAGGLSTYLHADYVRSMMPRGVVVKAMPDAGFFLDLPNWQGQPYYTPLYQWVASFQNVTNPGHVNDNCLSAKPSGQQWQCFMAPYTLPYIQTPIFPLNSPYDSWQLGNILQLPSSCINKISSCSTQQRAAFDNMRTVMLKYLDPAETSPVDGLFIDSCVVHCESLDDGSWNNFKVGGQNARQTVANWFFERSGQTKEIDGPWPSNPTCAQS